ncbi:MAG: enoyl-CoA hydratase/isomerase family protein, partial [Acidobacteria bacterium]
LLHAVVAADELAREVDDRCERLAAQSATGLATQKEIVHKWMTTDLETAIDFSINTVVLSFGSRDQREGMGSFLARHEEGGDDERR